MATKPKSYRKGDYIYTESSPGSNRYQNFTAAKPTVKKVRDDSRQDKAVVAAKKVTPPKYRGGPEGDGKAVVSMSSGKPSESKMARDEATRKVSRMGGMDTGNVMKKSYSSRQGGMDTGNVMKSKKGLLGTIINRVTQPPRKLTPASEKMLAEARAEITPVVTSLAGGRLLYKGGKKLVEAGAKFFRKKPSVPQSNIQPRPIEELFKKGKGTPRVKPATSRPFPKGKGTYKGKRTPGTYTAN